MSQRLPLGFAVVATSCTSCRPWSSAQAQAKLSSPERLGARNWFTCSAFPARLMARPAKSSGT
ncbi:MAG: hypothetical protein U0263_10065 [Polyangiaceae bacterium]